MAGDPQPGDLIGGKYRLERKLGAGGMGVVFAAEHMMLKQRVAVKFLLPEAASLPEARARFEREARAAAAIENEHVSRVMDIGETQGGAPYIVMEYLKGQTLAEVLRARGPLPLEEVADYVLQACEAIAEAHRRGITHRDLKPGNLFFMRKANGAPVVKVLDFGLSKFADGTPAERSLTRTNYNIGSAHYTAPEQLRSLRAANSASDIWSLGVVIYELLTGRRPFDATTVEAVCMAVALDPPMPLQSFRAGIPTEVQAIVAQCLEKDPSQRIQSVADLARRLAPFGTEGARTSLEMILGGRANEPTERLPSSADLLDDCEPTKHREEGASKRADIPTEPAFADEAPPSSSVATRPRGSSSSMTSVSALVPTVELSPSAPAERRSSIEISQSPWSRAPDVQSDELPGVPRRNRFRAPVLVVLAVAAAFLLFALFAGRRRASSPPGDAAASMAPASSSAPAAGQNASVEAEPAAAPSTQPSASVAPAAHDAARASSWGPANRPQPVTQPAVSSAPSASAPQPQVGSPRTVASWETEQGAASPAGSSEPQSANSYETQTAPTATIAPAAPTAGVPPRSVPTSRPQSDVPDDPGF